MGICFGHQVIAKALGGEVVKNLSGWELGSYKIMLTDAGFQNPIFNTFSNNEIVYESHQDVVVKLPSNAIELAYTVKGNQSYQLNNIFGVQFHPEFTWDVTRALMDIRIKKGVFIDSNVLKKSRKGKNILSNFVDMLEKGI